MFKTSLAYFFIRVLNGALALCSIYIFTRVLSAADYGLYSLGRAAITAAGAVCFQWIATAAARLYAAHAQEPELVISEGCRLFIPVALGVLIISIVATIWSPFHIDAPPLLLAIGIGIVSTGLHSFALQLTNANGRPVAYGLLTASRALVALASGIALVWWGFAAAGVVLGFVIGNTVAILLFGRTALRFSRYRSPPIRANLLDYGLPLIFTSLATMVLDYSDRFIIGGMLGPTFVASYSATYDLTQQTVGAILNVLYLAAFPKVAIRWEAGGRQSARAAMQPLARSFIFFLPLIIGGSIGGAADISNLMFGATIRHDATSIIPWIASAIAIGCFKNYFLDIAFQLAQSTKLQLYITISMAATNIWLNIILIPKFGVVGASMATAGAFALGALMSWGMGRRLGIYPITSRDLLSMLFVAATIICCMRFAGASNVSSLGGAAFRTLSGLTGFFVAAYIVNLGGARIALIKRSTGG